MKKILLAILIIILAFSMNVIAIDIDIGCAATDRSSWGETGYTYVNKTNPANESGKITSVEIWAYITMENVEVATFYVVSGDNLSTRDTHTIGTVTAGSKQTFSELDITVEAGDYIGIYGSAGNIELSVFGDVGIWWLSSDEIPCTDITFSYIASRGVSLYGTGTTVVGWSHKWNTKTIAKWNTKEFTKWNGVE